jgi:hypothetical protein
VQQKQDEYINNLLDFLDPSFPERDRQGWDHLSLRHGWVGQILITPEDGGVLAVQKFLRSFLEEWINTGFHADGSEWPDERNFAPKILPPEISWEGWSEKGGLPDRIQPPHALEAMAKFCNGTLQVNCGSGTYDIVSHREAETDSSVTVFIGPKGGILYEPTSSETHRHDPEMVAAGMFLMLYRSGSEWLFRLMQCRQCGSFDVVKKPRKSYIDGWYCSKKCRNVKAMVTTEKNRESKRKRWFGLAVDACARWDAMSPKPRAERIVWITEQVRSKLTLANKIARNTITHNLSEIEKQVRERDHAKG